MKREDDAKLLPRTEATDDWCAELAEIGMDSARDVVFYRNYQLWRDASLFEAYAIRCADRIISLRSQP